MKKAVFYDNQTKKKRGKGEESRSVLFTHAPCAYYFNYTSLTRNWGQGWGLLIRATLNVFAFCFFSGGSAFMSRISGIEGKEKEGLVFIPLVY